jgi:adenylosuccinate synthase
MKKRQISLIIDLQFGSTGKGLIAGFLATREKPDTIVTAWAANAGHTYIDQGGRKFIHTMLANGVVSKGLKRLLLGPGSLINPEALWDEIMDCAGLLQNVRIMIHPHAAVITQKHIDEEAGPMTKIGSTKKGVGAAMIDRIRRNPDDNNVAVNAFAGHALGAYVCTIAEYNAALDAAEVIQIEGAQGYSLSLYHGLYPYCTSRDVTPAQIFADCAIPLHWFESTEVIGTLRTFPIRVANRFDEEGKQVGFSGGCYPDQRELAWDELGMEAELTTVTKLPRRIFTLSQIQLTEAIRQCSVTSLFLNFANYCRSRDEFREVLATIRDAVTAADSSCGLCWVGFGPKDSDVVAIGEDTDIEELLKVWDDTAVVNQPR